MHTSSSGFDGQPTSYTPGQAAGSQTAAASPTLFQRLLGLHQAAMIWISSYFQTVAHSIRLTVSERRLILAVVDVVVLNAALLATLAIRADFPLSWQAISQARLYFILLTLLWGVWAAFFDCYDLVRMANRSQSAWSAGRAALLTALSYLAIPHITPDLPASRLTSLLFVALATASVPTWRLLYSAIFSQPIFQQHLLVVGAGRCGRELARTLAGIPAHGNPYAGSGYRMEGFVDDDPVRLDTFIEGVPVLGAFRDLPRLVQDRQVDLIVVAISPRSPLDAQVYQALLACRERGVGVEPMTSVYERLTGRVSVEHAGRDLVAVVPTSDSPMRHLFVAGKRLLDLAAAVCSLLVLANVAPLIAIANAIWCPGPLLYRQQRVGKGGRPFWVYKFRSMIPAAEQDCGAVWASEHDCRITPVGRVLRKTRLDELPQFLNVLRGEMSLIGPRPERPEFVSRLVKEVPFYQARHAVRPGITGWAQVRYRYGCSAEDALTKLQYDLYYIKHQSLYLELSILVKTAAVTLALKGR